jgi:hypothetical protein
MNRREIVLGATTAIVGMSAPARAEAQTKSIQDRLVGAWSLVDIYDKGKDGAQYYVWGEGVEGLAIYTPGGRFSLQIISAERPKGQSSSPRAPVGQSLGYFGRYSVDASAMAVRFKIDRCSFPAWDGQERLGKIALLTADELKTEIDAWDDPVHGDVIQKAQFKRVD